MKYKSPLFVLDSDGVESTIRSNREARMDGMVTGMIISLLVFPVLVAFVVFGLWMVYESVTEGAQVVILFMGTVFALGGLGLLKLFWGAIPSLFPFCWRIRKHRDFWELKKYVAGIKVFHRRCDRWSLRCLPSYSRGDWGHYFVLCVEGRKIRMTPPSACKGSKNAASVIAERDSAALRAHFGVECELMRWD